MAQLSDKDHGMPRPLDYQNRRAAHLSALWQIVNWEEIENRYNK